MQAVPIALLHPVARNRTRTVLVASADRNFRQRLSEILTGLRWQVREAEGGAQAWTEAEAAPPEAIIVDSWLPGIAAVGMPAPGVVHPAANANQIQKQNAGSNLSDGLSKGANRDPLQLTRANADILGSGIQRSVIA